MQESHILFVDSQVVSFRKLRRYMNSKLADLQARLLTMCSADYVRNFIMISFLYLSSVISDKNIFIGMIGWILMNILFPVPSPGQGQPFLQMAAHSLRKLYTYQNTYAILLIKFLPDIKGSIFIYIFPENTQIQVLPHPHVLLKAACSLISHVRSYNAHRP